MRQKIILILTLLLLVIYPVKAIIKPNIIVSGFDIIEENATVGKDFTLSLTLTNTEPSTCALNIMTSIQASYPFISKGVSSVASGDLCSQSNTIVNFPMKIDPTATGGFYQITVENNFETSTFAQFSTTSTLNLFVSGSPEIQAHIIKSNPIDIYPGDTATITVNVQNEGSFQAQSVSTNVQADEPLDIKWSESYDNIGTIEAKQGQPVEFVVEVPKDVPSGDYQLNFFVDYKDENLVKKIKQFSFTLHVDQKAMFRAIDSEYGRLFANQNSRLVKFKLMNTGTDAAHKLKIKLLPQFPFSTDGSLKYIEILRPNETSEAQFVVNIDKDGTAGTYGLELLVDFEDEQGKLFQDTTEISLAIEQKTTFRSVFIDFWFLWVLFALILLNIVRRKIRKKKKR